MYGLDYLGFKKLLYKIFCKHSITLISLWKNKGFLDIDMEANGERKLGIKSTCCKTFNDSLQCVLVDVLLSLS